MTIRYVKIIQATQKGKKLQAIFYDENKKKVETIPFGSKGMSDYTIHKDPERKKRYIDRHKAREDWTKPNNAGSLSRWILWGEPTLNASIKKYLDKFGISLLK